MKLINWLKEKRWNTAIFSRESGISLPILRKIVNGTGSITLDIALRIEMATKEHATNKGEYVTAWDLSQNTELIKKGEWPLAKTSPKNKPKKDKNQEHNNKKIEVNNFA